MRRTRTLWEVFVLRFEEAMERYRKRRLTAEEAGELLGMSGRHFRRLLGRYAEDGANGLRDRRLGKPSPRRAPPAELTRMQILHQGLFRAFYTDRGSHYFYTPKAGGKVDKSKPTQVGRALAQLGITHIPSYSPEARGRMERVFGTLQSRLPPELRLAEIATLEAANRYLTEQFVPDYNARFAVAAAEEGSAFIPYAGRPLADVLCVQ